MSNTATTENEMHMYEGNPVIRAKCYSDDRCVEETFNAVPWFEDATDKNIHDLAYCGWGGDYASDAVALFMADQHDGVAKMFTYIELRSRIETIGFECHVNQQDAMAWLKNFRTNLHEELTKLEE